ncbi:hypothetical protein PAPYR_3047 [Paratrimastix pyriformis]|uniref:Metallo-beta-lactamase domain-containing protein n=1 Tax=Paratrimastix pyriformis TaxID=342808 RepID=A0ABQ8UNP2_9EUKA|nr:hypothetical protein PAPYR_3047 [Paratrimastix pyriformis]
MFKWVAQSLSKPRYSVFQPGVIILTSRGVPDVSVFLLGMGPTRILVDVGWHTGAVTLLDDLQQAMENSGAQSLSAIIITHWHCDHILALDIVRDWHRQRFGTIPPSYKFPFPYPPKCGLPDVATFLPLADEQLFPLGPCGPSWEYRARVLHTPGHSPDHAALLVETVPSREQAPAPGAACPFPPFIICGDLFVGGGTSSIVIHLASYYVSIERLKQLCLGPDAARPSTASPAQPVTVLIPSHGEPLRNPLSDIDRVRAARVDRERRLLEQLEQLEKDPSAVGGCTLRDFLGSYPPQVRKNPFLATGALLNAHAHLEKLVAEGRVVETRCDNVPQFSADELANTSRMYFPTASEADLVSLTELEPLRAVLRSHFRYRLVR